MLKGVFFLLEKGKLSLVATDGRRLAVSSKQVPEEDLTRGIYSTFFNCFRNRKAT
jgi:DNA polymerase III sliding clamp (beta) subunit (PCNA family)